MIPSAVHRPAELEHLGYSEPTVQWRVLGYAGLAKLLSLLNDPGLDLDCRRYVRQRGFPPTTRPSGGESR